MISRIALTGASVLDFESVGTGLFLFFLSVISGMFNGYFKGMLWNVRY